MIAISVIAAVASALFAGLAWQQARALARRDRQITIEDLYDALIEQIDEIKRTNTDRWNACASTFEIAGRTKSGACDNEKAGWERDKEKLLSAIEGLEKLPNSFDRMQLDDLSRHHRTLRKIERIFQYERQKHEEWARESERAWGRSMDIRTQYK